MAMSSVTTFAASYKFEFGPLYSGPNVIYSKEALKTTSTYRDKVTQTTNSSYYTYYTLVTKTDKLVATDPAAITSSTTKYFTYKSGYGGNDQEYYLKGVAEEKSGRPGYTVEGNFIL